MSLVVGTWGPNLVGHCGLLGGGGRSTHLRRQLLPVGPTQLEPGDNKPRESELGEMMVKEDGVRDSAKGRRSGKIRIPMWPETAAMRRSLVIYTWCSLFYHSGFYYRFCLPLSHFLSPSLPLSVYLSLWIYISFLPTREFFWPLLHLVCSGGPVGSFFSSIV